jgi:tRNA(fMet)-specific endonuclease VapC
VIFLLDTTAASDLMRGEEGGATHLVRLASMDRVVVCPIVRGEIRYGIERLPQGRRRRDLAVKAARLLESLACEPVPQEAADHYARIKIATRAAGLPLDENDLWIAATALALGATLVTRDTDYQSITGLVIADWSQ